MSTNNLYTEDVPVPQYSRGEDSEATPLILQTIPDSETEEEERRAEEAEIAKRHFFRRPAPWWIWFLVLVAGVAVAATLAPLLDIFTALVCEELKPELAAASGQLRSGSGSIWPIRTIPIPSKMCRQDPTVQRAVAALVTAMDIAMGILSCLTVGYWMQLSDRFGRVKVLLVAAFGLIANHVVIALVSIMPEKLPGGYRFFLFGPIFEGVLGGRVLLSSVLWVYITDTSPLDLRTVNLGIEAGVDMLGNSVGPHFGAYLISRSENLLSVYYFAIGVYIFLTLVTIFLVPESLTKSKLKRGKRIYALTHKSNVESYSNSTFSDKFKAKIHEIIKLLNVPFEALQVFVPRRPRDGQTGAVLSHESWDWSLFLVGCVCFVEAIASNYTKYQFQYLQRVLGWDSQDISIWLGYNNAVRAVALIVILPLLIRWLRTKIRTSTRIRTSFSTTSRSESGNHLILDYILSISSMTVGVITVLCLSVVRHPVGWYIVTNIKSFSGGYEAALRSFSLSLYTRQVGQDSESGKFLGGISVLGLISGSMIGPVIFGSLYIHTVTDFPQAIFLVAGVLGLVTVGILSCIRVRVKA